LKNGLDIVAEVNPDSHSFAAGLFVNTGSRDETSDINGVSHFLEHMMFKGSDKYTWEDVNRIFDEIGARYNAFTSQEMTAYYANVLPEFTEKAVEHLSHLLRPAIRNEAFTTEKKVILGNHRDAWTHGAVDPNSGSAAQLEVARALAAALKSGWKPKRTIILASWDAEEYGLVGSTEWAEEHAAGLQKNAVAYLNGDAVVTVPEPGMSATAERALTAGSPGMAGAPRGGACHGRARGSARTRTGSPRRGSRRTSGSRAA
jgi:hypothetical protein